MQEQSMQGRRESRMDAMGTCTYDKSETYPTLREARSDVYNQLQKGWLAFGNKVPPKDSSKSLQQSFQNVSHQRNGGSLAPAEAGTSGPLHFITPVGASSTVFESM